MCSLFALWDWNFITDTTVFGQFTLTVNYLNIGRDTLGFFFWFNVDGGAPFFSPVQGIMQSIWWQIVYTIHLDDKEKMQIGWFMRSIDDVEDP